MTISSASFVLGAAGWRDLPRDGKPEIAFLGRSNVGKSSLINLLVGRKALARTSNTPGKTQQFNYYLVNEALYFVDLPGIGYAKIGKSQRLHWSTMIERYVEEREELRMMIHLVDSRHDPTAYDQAVMESIRGLDMAYLVALTKGDKLSKNKRQKSVSGAKKVLASFGIEAPVVLTSAAKKQGKDELLDWIGSVV